MTKLNKLSYPLKTVIAVLLALCLIAGAYAVNRYLNRPAQQPASESQNSTSLELDNYTFTAFHPPSFKLEAINLDLELPRIIHFYGERILIGSRSGNVYWMDPPYTETNILAEIEDYPHSVVVKDDYIYIATTSAIIRAPYSLQTQSLTKNQFETYLALPGGKGHSSRTLKRGPDQKLYVSIGIRGNCSDEYLHPSYPSQKQRGGISRIDEIHGAPTLASFASGLRNPVGYDWHPVSKEMYASNNGPGSSWF